MSSVIFQPLLHDPLGWKSSNTTYADAFKWKKYRTTTKDKKISAYGQQYQRQMEKRRQQQQQQQQQPTASFLPAASEEQTIERVNLTKRNEEYRALSSASHRQPSSKTPPLVVVVEEPPILVVEYKQRPTSTNREASFGSRVSQRSPTAPAAVEETSRPATSLEARQSPKEEKEKVYIDANNDNSRHWLTYPNPKTPQYLIDIKQRLGQLKIPSTLARAASVVNTSVERPESSVSQRPRQPSADERHFLDFNLPETPVELRAARQRLDKHRYNPSLDNHFPRPKTSPEHKNEKSKPLTPQPPPPAPEASESEDEHLPNVQTTATKDDAWIPEDENQPTEKETPFIVVQSIDIEGVPNEYVEALEIANVAQDEYLKNLKFNVEKRPDQTVYRLPSRSSDEKNESFVAYRNQQQQQQLPLPKTNHSTRQNNFGSWIRNATDRERESAMKILHDVLNQPILGYDIPKQQTAFKQAPAPSSVRTSSATRKLGRTRTHQRMPCEICEKQLIKQHVWDLSRSDTGLCAHQAQGIKPPAIEVRA